jgi:PA domain/LVIVD repeat
MRRRFRWSVVLTLVLALSSSTVAEAHPEPGAHRAEDFPGEGISAGGMKQHGPDEGHLPPVQENVTLVGKAEVTNPSGAGNDGRIADVFAKGNYAYLNAFFEPTCENTGVHVIDISDLRHPVELTDAFIPTSVGSYAGEGIQVVEYRNRFFRGDLLIHQNETCPFGPDPTDPAMSGGISLWNVTDPRHPQPVTRHTGDVTNDEGGVDPAPNTVHSMRHWYDAHDRKHYVALQDNEEFTDIDILDITDPFHPVLVNDTLDLVALFGVDQAEPGNLQDIFHHDLMIEKVGNRYVMNVSYWDGGYVLLDVTDPTPGNVGLIAESDYALLDEERLARGHEISPEGNGHQSELSPDNRFLIATDEDFGPLRPTGVIQDGPSAGFEYEGGQAPDTPIIDEDTTITGTVTYVGDGCTATPPPPGSGIALAERGSCTFQEKLDNIAAAGYSTGVVFQQVRPDCRAVIRPAAESETVPLVFVNRETGLRLLNQEISADPCTQASPAPGTAGASTSITAQFDGWGYVRMFDVDLGRPGRPGSIEQIDTYAIPEAQDPAFADGFGDLSVHEVAIDPDRRLAYFSYYAGGFRVARYGRHGLTEVGAFIDEGGNNFWGVEVYERHGRNYVLASDRDFGLYIFRYTP